MERSEGLNWWYISLSKEIRDKDQREREMLIGRHGKGKAHGSAAAEHADVPDMW